MNRIRVTHLGARVRTALYNAPRAVGQFILEAGHPRFYTTYLKGVCAFHLFLTHVFDISGSCGPSMVPTFSVAGDWIACDLSYRPSAVSPTPKLQRFLPWPWGSSSGPKQQPLHELTPEQREERRRKERERQLAGLKVGDMVLYKIPVSAYDIGVKRIVGLPGDYVLLHTPKAVYDDEDAVQQKMIQVPEGHCWIVGDNLPVSRDSRTFGPVPLALIMGKVVGRVFPWQERQWFTGPGVEVVSFDDAPVAVSKE